MKTSTELALSLNPAKPRCTQPRRWLAAIAVLGLSWPVLVWGDCVDTRKATAAEVEFHGRAMAALVAALPPVPVGGKLQNKDSVTTLGQQCRGVTGDFNLEATRFYELNFRKAIVSVAINARQLRTDAAGLSESYGVASPSRSAALKVNNVVWTVSGSDSPLRQALVDAMDRTRLQGFVGKPLPSVAESEALASQAVPPAIAGPAAGSPGPQATVQTASPPAAAPEPIREAVDAVNKLRGLFGR